MSGNNLLTNLIQSAIQIMLIKSFLPFILLVIVLLLIITGINRCSIEQNDRIACQVTEKKVLSELDVPFSAKSTFTYSKIDYAGTGLYFIYGSIKTEYVNGNFDIKYFRSVIEAKGNDESDFQVFRFEFIEKNEE